MAARKLPILGGGRFAHGIIYVDIRLEGKTTRLGFSLLQGSEFDLEPSIENGFDVLGRDSVLIVLWVEVVVQRQARRAPIPVL